MKLPFLLMGFLLISACGTENVTVEEHVYQERIQRYNDNMSLWQSKSVASYKFDFTIDWYCHEDSDKAQTFYVQDGSPLNESNLSIDEVFLEVKSLIELKSYVLEVDYDSTYGFPIKVEYDKYYSIEDDARCILLSDFQSNI